MTTPTHQDRLAAVTAAIVKAVPKLRERAPGGRWLYKDIGLEHAIFAMTYCGVPFTAFSIELNGNIRILNPDNSWTLLAQWHLCIPLNLQSEALISFLHPILCPTK